MSKRQYHLCHLNIGKARAHIFDPQMAGFVAKLEEVNNLAYQSPGFVWHLQIDIYNPEHLAMYGEPGLLFNLSVWESVEALYTYVYRSDHAQMMKARKNWFGEMDGPSYVLFWLPAGELPTLEEAKQRIAYLKAHGPSAQAFTFKDTFPPPSFLEEAAEPDGVMVLQPRTAAKAGKRALPG